MEEQNAVIEITDTEIRLAVGYVKDKKPHLTHFATRPIKGLISHGEIIDFKTLTEIISSLREVRGDSPKDKYVINEVTVVLPAIGLGIYECEAVTKVCSPESVISQLDIENLISQARKQEIPNANDIIDIIPDVFKLDGGRIVTALPIGLESNEIVMQGKIHTLPSRFVAQYKTVIEDAHLTIKRFCLNSYATCELATYNSEIPPSYLLVDMGSEVSSITLVANRSPYGTMPFDGGGSYIVNNLVTNYGISPENGLELLTKCGYDTRILSFSPNISNNEEIELTQNDLNRVIIDYFETEFFPRFDAALDSLLKGYEEQVKNLPIVFIGGFSMMIGFDKIAQERFVRNQSIHFLSPKTLGARSSQYCSSIGGLMLAYSRKGALSELAKKSKGLYR